MVGIALGAVVGVGGAIAGGLLATTVWRTYRETTRQRDRLAASVAFSALIALTLTPMLASRLPGLLPQASEDEKTSGLAVPAA